ncbi:SET domain bifurcated [Cichlidogyrus casuarinus]|uniref:SET domain bifurcated n=1 Tax=Cichlidogyrus casuarinus TaxID=1844966 RepID=A0ABD2QEE1_9PLAT
MDLKKDIDEFLDKTLDEQLLKNIFQQCWKEFEDPCHVIDQKTKEEMFLEEIPDLLRKLKIADELTTMCSNLLGLDKLSRKCDVGMSVIRRQDSELNRIRSSYQTIQNSHELISRNNSEPSADLEKELLEAFIQSPIELAEWSATPPSQLVIGMKVDVSDPVYHQNDSGEWKLGLVFERFIEEDTDSLNNYLYVVMDVNSLEAVKPDRLAIKANSYQLKEKYSVGTRILVVKDKILASGLIADPPAWSNSFRYLIFLDDGSVAYAHPIHVHRILKQTTRNYKRSNPDDREFIADYLKSYPQRHLLKFRVDQEITILRRKTWEKAKVIQTDACLVLVKYLIDSSTEWLYRGSQRHHNLAPNTSDISPSFSLRHLSVSPRIRALIELESSGVTQSYLSKLVPDLKSRPFVPHDCNSSCLLSGNRDQELPANHRDANFADLPFRCGWLREVCTPLRRGVQMDEIPLSVVYVAPCGRRLATTTTLRKYLDVTNSALNIANFCFDAFFLIDREFVPQQLAVEIKDISYGKEVYPIACVNSIDHEYTPYMDYASEPIPHELTPKTALDGGEFNVCCECTNDCRDKAKCACQQLTIEMSVLANKKRAKNNRAGYKDGRLMEFQPGGIVECNDRCACKVNKCENRLVQRGLKERLQVFKTAQKGWGIRTLRPIQKGSFIAVYSGALYSDIVAEEVGIEAGDEYQANMDFIEIVEHVKQDYEESALPMTDEEDDELKAMSPVDEEEVRVVSPIEPEPKNDQMPIQKARKTMRSHVRKGMGPMPSVQEDCKHPRKHWIGFRAFCKEEEPYVMDAKKMGNLARYFNHSCNPNVFVQSVFTQTQDPRFPKISFFAMRNIEAGEELCWDYSYAVGSVEGKELYCYCGSTNCRRRLL